VPSPIDIRTSDLEIVQTILRECLPKNMKIWVFGSRAKWTTKDSSDLDIAIDVGRKLTKAEVSQLEDAFAESDLPYRVDIVDLHYVSDNFKEIIEQDKVALPMPLSDKSGGGVMSDWQLKRISDVADFLNYKRVPLSSLDRDKRKGKFPYYGASGIVDYIDDYIFDGTYLLVSEDGENLRTRKTPIAFKATGKFWVNNHAHILAEKEEGILDYLEYYFSNFDLTPFLTGAVQPKLNKANLDKIEIPVPKKRDRLAINKHLNSLSGKITINQQINQTLEAMAQGLFKSWFVDFEPTHAKVAVLEAGGTEEDANIVAMTVISGKSDEDLAALKTTNADAYAELHATASLFPSRLVESELGEIPDGWNLSEIGNEIEAVGGGTPSTKEAEFWGNGTVHWTTPKDMSDLKDKVLIDTERKITEAGLRKISSGLLPVDTVLMSSRAPVGYLAIAKIPVAINQGYIAMKCNKRLSPEFVIQWCVHNMEEIKQRASGTTFAEISKKSFYPIPVVVPATPVLQIYTRSVRNLYSQIESLARENQNLSITRDSLLPKLLSGEISVENQLGSEG
jgi:type I restriction enzyme S subunit